jgi:hypothetical protein
MHAGRIVTDQFNRSHTRHIQKRFVEDLPDKIRVLPDPVDPTYVRRAEHGSGLSDFSFSLFPHDGEPSIPGMPFPGPALIPEDARSPSE